MLYQIVGKCILKGHTNLHTLAWLKLKKADKPSVRKSDQSIIILLVGRLSGVLCFEIGLIFQYFISRHEAKTQKHFHKREMCNIHTGSQLL